MVKAGKLACDMSHGCERPVTHIGEKGYVYCATHAPQRRGYERTRKLLVSERKALEAGGTLPSFERKRTASADRPGGMDRLEPRDLRADEVTFTVHIESETTPVEGNASAWGDGTDEPYWQSIRERLEQGDIWAWCSVEVRADWNGYTGSDYLGGCCYADEADFRQPGGYFDDMKVAALAQLNDKVRAAWETVAPLLEPGA